MYLTYHIIFLSASSPLATSFVRVWQWVDPPSLLSASHSSGTALEWVSKQRDSSHSGGQSGQD